MGVPEPDEKKKEKKSPSVDPKRFKTSLHCSPKKLLYQKSYIANTPITHHTHSIFNLIPNRWAMAARGREMTVRRKFELRTSFERNP